jgi:hypothetical protein
MPLRVESVASATTKCCPAVNSDQLSNIWISVSCVLVAPLLAVIRSLYVW